MDWYKEACQKLDVTPVVIDRKPESIPYALNLEQFADGTVLLTGGDSNLTESIRQIVGTDKVYVTSRPVIFTRSIEMAESVACYFLHLKRLLENR